jgi:hypothetical protein
VKFEVGFRGLDRLRALPGKLAETVDEAERKTVLVLSQIGTRLLRDRLSGVDRKRRTGNLARSVATSEPRRVGTGGWEGLFGYGRGVAARYARILEEGGTITPKSAKVLAVPVGNALTATGRARFASPREVEGGFWLSRPGRPPLVVVERGGSKSRRLDVLFVGLPRVTLEGKRSAAKAAEAAQGQARRVLDEQIRAALAPAGF